MIFGQIADARALGGTTTGRLCGADAKVLGDSPVNGESALVSRHPLNC